MEVSVRRAEAEDADFVNALLADDLSTHRRRFGRVDVAALIESAYLSVTAVSDSGEVVGFAAFSDSPTVNYVGEDWVAWFQKACGAEDSGLANTIWVSCFVAKPMFDLDAAENIIRTAFTTLNDVDYALLLLPKGMDVFSPLSLSFEEVPVTNGPAAEELDYDGEFGEKTVFCCNRESFIPTLTIRQARVEDHDDLVPIFNSQSEVLTELYGEFFIAELIEAQNDTTKALVADVDGRAVGLMSLTSDIKLDVLQQCFELSPYNDLMMRTVAEQRAAELAEGEASAVRRDWLSTYRGNEELLDAVYESVGSRASDDSFNLSKLAEALNTKGQEWSFQHRRKLALGDVLVGTLLAHQLLTHEDGAYYEKSELSKLSATRRQVEMAILEYESNREEYLRRYAVYRFYKQNKGRNVVTKAFSLAANYEKRENDKDAAVQEATVEVDGEAKASDSTPKAGESKEETKEQAEGPKVALGDLAAVISVMARESSLYYRGTAVGDDILDLLGLDEAVDEELVEEDTTAVEEKEEKGEEDAKQEDGADVAAEDGDDAAETEEVKEEPAGDGIVRISLQQLNAALDRLEEEMAAQTTLRAALFGGPGVGKKTAAEGVARRLGAVVVDVTSLLDSAVPPAEESDDEADDEDDEEEKQELTEKELESKAAARKFKYGLHDLTARLREADCRAGWILVNLPENEEALFEISTTLLAEGLETRAIELVTPDRVARSRALPDSGDSKLEEEYGNSVVAWNKMRQVVLDGFGRVPGAIPLIDSSTSKGDVVEAIIDSVVDLFVLRAPEDEEHESAIEEAHAAESKSSDEQDVPKSNAFAVTLFCLDELFDSRAGDFLEHVFAAYDDLDYCLLTLPHASPETPLLSRFTLVPPKPSSTFSHVLYVAHRASLLAPHYLSVRRCVVADRLGLSNLLRDVENAGTINAAVSRADAESSTALTSDPGAVAFVAECQDQIVGVIVLSSNSISEERVNQLRDSFELDRYLLLAKQRLRSQAELSEFVINPIFASASRYVLRQAMRLYDKTVLYYPLRAGDVPVPILEDLVQVRPRNRPEQAGSGGVLAQMEQISSGAAPGPSSDAGDDSHALFFLSRKLMSEPKLVNNSRVVVVGASDTSICFLETLLMVAYIRFTNITLISPGGLPSCASELAGTKTSRQAGAPWGLASEYSPVELERLALASRIRVLDSKVCEIDREARAVVLPDDSIVPFDVLVIGTGLQDQSAASLGVGREDAVGLDSRVCSVSGADSNSALEDAVSATASDISAGSADVVVVYGDALESYTAINALVARGIPGDRIVHARPGSAAIVTEPSVQEAVDATLSALGVVSHKTTKIVQAQVDSDDRGLVLIAEADGDSDRRVALPCRLLITAHTPDVDSAIFAAVNGCGLPYDGRLVVDHRFRTTQKEIFAGGSIAKYARRYRAPHWLQSFNSREAGAALGYSVLGELDPLMATERSAAGAAEDDDAGGARALQRFVLPHRHVGVLPGGQHYFHASLATVDMGTSGRQLSTNVAAVDSATGKQHMMALSLDRYGRLAALQYLGEERVESQNLFRLVGRHSGFMNGVERDYDAGNIKDFVTFLRQDWAYAVYHDLFDYLCLELREALADDEHLQQLLQATWEDVGAKSSDAFIRKKREASVGPYGSKLHPTTRRTIENGVLEFLRANRSLLPMYFLPKGDTR